MKNFEDKFKRFNCKLKVDALKFAENQFVKNPHLKQKNQLTRN
ncbi:hypothetical protein LCGC14_0378070 [marine sediment metagenome]|uniref:Uncharacterized protein n=1 Tax=marine sediment metagenome TaxID=412755 RepID=A0A0F9T918_9ZZZZ